jgi:hypothetical protein
MLTALLKSLLYESSTKLRKNIGPRRLYIFQSWIPIQRPKLSKKTSHPAYDNQAFSRTTGVHLEISGFSTEEPRTSLHPPARRELPDKILRRRYLSPFRRQKKNRISLPQPQEGKLLFRAHLLSPGFLSSRFLSPLLVFFL